MNPKNILNLLYSAFNDPAFNIESKITDEERSFASYLTDLIKVSSNTKIFVENYETLCYYDDSVEANAVSVEDEVEEDFDDYEEKEISDQSEVVDLDYKQRAVTFWRKTSTKKRRSLDSVKKNFKMVKHEKMLYRWEKQIEEGGSRLEKLRNISKYVLQQFNNATENRLPVHDIDLKRWGLLAKENVQLASKYFKASSKWVHNFKVKHGIVSRKVNKFVTTAQLTNQSELKQAASEFVDEVWSEVEARGKKNVYNSDQSGFNLEVHAGRTLAIIGTQKVECLAQSINSLTHSYTIQPIVSADGKLHSPLLIVLKEPDGKFGPLVQSTIYKADNIYVLPSKSGKLTSDIVTEWFKNVFLLAADTDSLLILDSWTGQNEKVFEKLDTGMKNIQIKTIPAGTTGMIQPLDVYGFRPWKNFVKNFSDIVMLYNFSINLHLRNNILKLQSLTHNQFSSPRFTNMFKYGWYKSGYVLEKPNSWQTPVQYCFQNTDVKCHFCMLFGIVKCAWCTKCLCINHFFALDNVDKPHYCKQYVDST